MQQHKFNSMRRICLHVLLLFVVSLYAGKANAQLKLIWSDEFDSPQLNNNSWTVLTGYGAGNDGWGNNELQNYTPHNISFADNCLVITARKTGDDTKRGDYTSARITTKGKQEFLYGRIEARLKFPQGRGVWPAFWMLGAQGGWPDNGEIDILEYVGYEPEVIHSALHTRSSFGNTVNKDRLYVRDLEKDFHIFGINWTKDKIEFYIDNPDYPYYTYAPKEKTAQNWPFDKPQYILLNLAVGGGWGGRKGVDNTIFPQEYLIDWVRVYVAE